MRYPTLYKWIAVSVLYAILVVVLSVIIAPWIGVDDTGEVLAFVQIVVAVLVLLPAIVTFVQQLISLQSVPELDVKWNIQVPMGATETFLELPNHGTKTWTTQPILMNNGNGVTPWYLFTFNVPAELLGMLDDFELRPIVGTMNEHWKVGYIKDPINPAYWSITFMSNGQIASYPNNDMFLSTLQLNLYSDRRYQDSYTIKYMVAADKGKRKDGELVLRLQKENLSMKISEESLLDHLLRFSQYDRK